MAEKIRKDGTISAIHGMFTQVRKMQLRDWRGFFLLILSFIPGKIVKLFYQNIWVVSEYEGLARDNGYWLYKHIREEHKEINAYYPIARSSPDYEKIKALGNDVKFGSFKHYCLFWAAQIYLGTTKCFGFPYRRICEDIVQWHIHRFKYIFLNHGFTRGYSSIVDANDTNYDMIITCGEKDSRIIIEENGQDEGIVKCVGYARHDSLDNNSLDRKQILVMPTWRRWLNNPLTADPSQTETNKKLFEESLFFRKYYAFINSEQVECFLDKNDLHLVFYLHEFMQSYSDLFSSCSNRIIIGTNTQYDIQQLLKQSAILITDYSSVCYDFAYLHKPVVFYQFDKDEFEKKQYGSGTLFSYEKDGFGRCVYNEKELIEEIEQAYKSGFVMDPLYMNRVDDFFAFRDHHNCERIYETIINMNR